MKPPPTLAEREAAFQRHLETTVEYFAAVIANGDQPWFTNPEKLSRLGIDRKSVV